MRHTIEELRGYLLQIEPHENYRSFVDGWNKLSAALDELESLRPLPARVKELEDDLAETARELAEVEAENELRMRRLMAIEEALGVS